jgi:hypothetical protein
MAETGRHGRISIDAKETDSNDDEDDHRSCLGKRRPQSESPESAGAPIPPPRVVALEAPDDGKEETTTPTPWRTNSTQPGSVGRSESFEWTDVWCDISRLTYHATPYKDGKDGCDFQFAPVDIST